jgi:multiple antibiotic resistance protein
MSLLTLSLTLFLVINPLGNTKSFITLLGGLQPWRRNLVIVREMFLALILMFIFSFLGEWIASIFSIDQTTIYLSSGVILFLSAIKIIFSKEEPYIPRVEGEPLLVPIAIPMVASPALLAMIMLFSQVEPLVLPMVLAIVFSWFFSMILLLLSPFMLRILGGSGLLAIERLMGMVLVLIAVQRFMEGILSFYNQQM